MNARGAEPDPNGSEPSDFSKNKRAWRSKGAKETASHAAGYDPLKLVFEKLVQYVVDEARASRGLKTSEETRAFPVCPREQRALPLCFGFRRIFSYGNSDLSAFPRRKREVYQEVASHVLTE